MKEAIIKLINGFTEMFTKVKSVMTLAILFVFVYLSVTERLQNETIVGVIMMVTTYYFTKDANKIEGK
jgi:uncharacterized membrane protein